jgi:hypothetical protein
MAPRLACVTLLVGGERADVFGDDRAFVVTFFVVAGGLFVMGLVAPGM